MQSHTIADYALNRPLGRAYISYRVSLTPSEHAVVLAPVRISISGDRFDFQDYLTADEAETLAAALLETANRVRTIE